MESLKFSPSPSLQHYLLWSQVSSFEFPKCSVEQYFLNGLLKPWWRPHSLFQIHFSPPCVASGLDFVGVTTAAHAGNDPYTTYFWSAMFPGGSCELQLNWACFMSDLMWCKQSAYIVYECLRMRQNALLLLISHYFIRVSKLILSGHDFFLWTINFVLLLAWWPLPSPSCQYIPPLGLYN